MSTRSLFALITWFICVDQCPLQAAASWTSCRRRCWGERERRSSSDGRRRRGRRHSASTQDPASISTWTSCRSKVRAHARTRTHTHSAGVGELWFVHQKCGQTSAWEQFNTGFDWQVCCRLCLCCGWLVHVQLLWPAFHCDTGFSVCVCWTTGMFLIEQMKEPIQPTHNRSNDLCSNKACVCVSSCCLLFTVSVLVCHLVAGMMVKLKWPHKLIWINKIFSEPVFFRTLSWLLGLRVVLISLFCPSTPPCSCYCRKTAFAGASSLCTCCTVTRVWSELHQPLWAQPVAVSK